MARSILQKYAPLIIATALIGPAIVAGVWLRPVPPLLPQYRSAQAQQENYVPGGPNCGPTQTRRPIDRKGPDKTSDCHEKAEQHRQTEADLVQQTRAADAAQEGAKLTYYQSKALLWATLLGYCTLVAAAFAAWYARKAAVASQAALVADHRAWLAIKNVTFGQFTVGISPDGDAIVAALVKSAIENHGNGPAINCTLQITWRAPGEAWEAIQVAAFDPVMPKATSDDLPTISVEELDDIWRHGLLYLWIRVTYQIAGEAVPRTTTQQLVVAELAEPMRLEQMNLSEFRKPGHKTVQARVIRTDMT